MSSSTPPPCNGLDTTIIVVITSAITSTIGFLIFLVKRWRGCKCACVSCTMSGSPTSPPTSPTSTPNINFNSSPV